MQTATDANQEAGPALRRFAAGLRRRFVLGHALGAGLRAGVGLAAPLIGVAWLAPSLLTSCAAVAAVCVALSAATGFVRARWRSRRLLSSLQRGAGRDVAADQVFHDELLTWLEWDRKASTSSVSVSRDGMVRWLEEDVYERLQPRRRDAERATLRVGLGRWRVLLVVSLALALAWLMGFWLQPPWRGVVGGESVDSSSTEARDDGSGEHPEQRGEGQAEEEQEAPSEPGAEAAERVERAAPERPQPAAPAIPEGEAPEPEDPVAEESPLVDAPDDRRFILPDFIGDGPTRRERMHVAELERPRAGDGARAERSRAGGAERPRPPASPALEFQRAAERAARSRHVPAHERSMVRRFFQKLQQEGRR